MMSVSTNMAYNSRVEVLRDREYPMLKDAVYLDHAGTTLYSKSLIDKFATEMTSNLFGNPHSASESSQMSTARIDDVRLQALRFFHADPSEFDLVFVSNTTAAIKLVTEAFRCGPKGFNYIYHEASHTSLVGVREEARNSLCLDADDVEGWLRGGSFQSHANKWEGPTLFAYPAQSNMTGERFPLSWADLARRRSTASETGTGDGIFTLLDAAALVSTSPLHLDDPDTAPDFTVFSFYKMFGFPDLGGLIIRRQAAPVFQHRKYFGGGTVDMVVCIKEHWHALKNQSLHESLEDGTLPVHSIVSLGIALQVHCELFDSMDVIARHTSFLAAQLYDGLKALRHGNGENVCDIYSLPPHAGAGLNGPIVAFNLRGYHGAWVSLSEFEKLASLKKFHIRTGGLCNPGGVASALGLEPWEMKENFSAGFRCGSENDIVGGKPTGVIRVSLGAMSTVSDVDDFVTFIEEFYRNKIPPVESLTSAAADSAGVSATMQVEQITVYPIKSCGGYHVPKGMTWEVRPEGLAWDREWCLVHCGTGQALSQKRYPRMALLKPTIDFQAGCLRVPNPVVEHSHATDPSEIRIPLSGNPKCYRSLASASSMASRVCGEEISTRTYANPEINDFFSGILGVPCALVRFPPGGQGKSMRHAKAHLQKHQLGGPSGVVTPPDSDSETEQRQRILLSNESPILAISRASLDMLNSNIKKRGELPVSADVFRANIVISSSDVPSSLPPYQEDHWAGLLIGGRQRFKMLGSCRRCHMVCIDQETAEKRQEPFISLAKTRQFDNKVFFGTHMSHVPSRDTTARDAQFPTIQVGEEVQVDGMGR